MIRAMSDIFITTHHKVCNSEGTCIQYRADFCTTTHRKPYNSVGTCIQYWAEIFTYYLSFTI